MANIIINEDEKISKVLNPLFGCYCCNKFLTDSDGTPFLFVFGKVSYHEVCSYQCAKAMVRVSLLDVYGELGFAKIC